MVYPLLQAPGGTLLFFPWMWVERKRSKQLIVGSFFFFFSLPPFCPFFFLPCFFYLVVSNIGLLNSSGLLPPLPPKKTILLSIFFIYLFTKQTVWSEKYCHQVSANRIWLDRMTSPFPRFGLPTLLFTHLKIFLSCLCRERTDETKFNIGHCR